MAFRAITQFGCPPQEPIIEPKERYVKANVEALRTRTRWERVG